MQVRQRSALLAYSQFNPPRRPDDVQIARPREAVVLARVVQLQSQVFIERVTDEERRSFRRFHLCLTNV